MANKHFLDVMVKVERAIEHFNQLEAILGTFVDDHEKALIGEDYSNQGEDRSLAGSIPRETPAIIGDLIHNLRASLDYAYCVCTERNGKTVPESGVFGFPFRETNDIRTFAIGGKKPKPTPSASVLDYIVDEMQPYEGGKWGLYTLHLLDRADKHQLLIPTGASHTLKGEIRFVFPDGGKTGFVGPMEIQALYSYGKPAGFLIPAGVRGVPENKGKLPASITLDIGGTEGAPVIRTLARAIRVVHQHLLQLEERSR